MTATVYHCPPLNARLPAASCARNHERAADAAKHPKREGSHAILLKLRCCVNCVGVEALAKMWQQEPQEIEVAPRSIADYRGTSDYRGSIKPSAGQVLRASMKQKGLR